MTWLGTDYGGINPGIMQADIIRQIGEVKCHLSIADIWTRTIATIELVGLFRAQLNWAAMSRPTIQ